MLKRPAWKNIRNNRGLTLIELIITVAISSIVLAVILSVMLSINKSTHSQFDESKRRNEVRLISIYLTDDIRFSKGINLVTDKRLEIVNRNGMTVKYYLKNAGHDSYLVREYNGLLECEYIKDVNFSRISDDLVSVDLITDKANNKYNNFKIARWVEHLDNIPGKLKFDNIFVFGATYTFGGGMVEALDGAIYINGSFNGSQMNGGAFANVKDIYIDGNFYFNGGGADLGLTAETPGDIHVSGRFELRSGGRDIFANVYAKEYSYFKDATIHGNVEIQDNADLVGGTFKKDVRIDGNVYIKDAVIHGDVYVNGNVRLDWTPQIHGKIYYTGTLSHPAYYHQSILSKCIKVPAVDELKDYVLDYKIPFLRESVWYTSRGYKNINTALSDNVRIYAEGDYSYRLFNVDAHDIIVVSTGNITLDGNWRKASGILFAPNGKVTIKGLQNFEGIVIAKNGLEYNVGGSKLKFIDINKLIPNKEDYPFLY